MNCDNVNESCDVTRLQILKLVLEKGRAQEAHTAQESGAGGVGPVGDEV